MSASRFICVTIASVATLICAGVRLAGATHYYVWSRGSDSNSGKASAPFATIQKAASLAVAGDVVFIQKGVYHETVRPAHSGTPSSPIVFRTIGPVTIDGADVVSGWKKYSGSIYRAPMKWALGRGDDQVLVDGQMMNAARWPHTGLDPMRPTFASAAAGTNGVQIVDPNLPSPAGFWNGATVWFLGGKEAWEPWVAQTATVTNYLPGKITFATPLLNTSDFLPISQTPYFLTGGPLESLGAPSEWWIGNGYLYLWPTKSDSPVAHLVEAKRRQFGFDLSNRSYVSVEGINFLATGLSMDNSTGCIVDRCQFRYSCHFSVIDSGWNTRDDIGIVVGGTGNVVKDCTVRYAAGNGVTILGANNSVTNCYIRGVDYAGTDSTGIRIAGSKSSATFNTITEAARAGLLNRSLSAGTITHNDFSEFSMWTQDTGGTYCWSTDGQGTVIAYNRSHDAWDTNVTRTVNGRKITSGIYLDNGSPNHIVHHNLIYNMPEGFRLNPPSPNNLILNNTVENPPGNPSIAGGGDFTGTQIVNNIFNGYFDVFTGATVLSNLLPGVDPLFVSPGLANYSLTANSPAIRAGQIVPPYTNGYLGSAPDIGAFERGVTPWTAGADFVPAQPGGVKVTAENAAIRVDWRAEKGLTYNLLIRTTFGPWTLVRVLARGPYLITKLKNGTAYQVALESVNSTGLESPMSQIFSVTPSVK